MNITNNSSLHSNQSYCLNLALLTHFLISEKISILYEKMDQSFLLKDVFCCSSNIKFLQRQKRGTKQKPMKILVPIFLSNSQFDQLSYQMNDTCNKLIQSSNQVHLQQNTKKYIWDLNYTRELCIETEM